MQIYSSNFHKSFMPATRDMVIPFIFQPRLNPPIQQGLFKYPNLANRLVCATRKAFGSFCRNEQLLAAMNKTLQEENSIDILDPIACGFRIQRLGNNNEFFALALSGESTDILLRNFFELYQSTNDPIIRNGIAIVLNHMRQTGY